MRTIHARNVNEAFSIGLRLMQEVEDKCITIAPRGAATIEYPEPVATTYAYPVERLLFNSQRHANPFFHLIEALWMLDGRRDVSTLVEFNKRIAQYSDNGTSFHGAYGYRLRTVPYDQVREVIKLLRNDPDTRRAVLTIWDPVLDLNVESLDIPCNDTIFFKLRADRLRMTVACRSNDVIWGAYGANAVQFSILQEYVARCVGVQMGTYTQVSDSFHIYTDNPVWQRCRKASCYFCDLYEVQNLQTMPLFVSAVRFDHEVTHFLKDLQRPGPSISYFEPLIVNVAWPMVHAWRAWKDTSSSIQNRYVLASAHCNNIAAADWRLACKMWLVEARRRLLQRTPNPQGGHTHHHHHHHTPR